MEEAEHSRLAFADRVGERFEKPALERDPVRRGVHFVFGELEIAGADIFVGEEFNFLEADDLRAN